MKIAVTVNKIVGEKGTQCLVLVKKNPMATSATPVYGSLAGVAMILGKAPEALVKGDIGNYDTDLYGPLDIVDMVNSDTGEVITAKDGAVLQQFKG